MSSIIEICNAALSHLGERRVMSLAEASEEAKICNARFDPCRRAVLEIYPWKFAGNRVVTSPDVSTPAFEYDYKHLLPADFVRVICLYQYEGRWVREGRYILCNTDTLQLVYVTDFTDMAHVSPLFAECLGFYLAMDIAKSITESDTDREAMQSSFERALARGKFVQSGSHHQDVLDDSTLTDARWSSGYVRDPMTH